jgi:hypothetical protein
MPDSTNIALDAPLDILITAVPSLGTESIDPHHLGTAADKPDTGRGSLMEALDAVVSAPAMPGSLHGLLPDDLYVFAIGSDPQQPIRFGDLGWGYKCHVVTDRFKSVVEQMPGARSEFYPVSVVYRGLADSDELGGGDVVRGSHWIWYCYAVHDIIDVPASHAIFQRTSQPRLDVAGHPEVAFDVVGADPADGLTSIVLRATPYDEDAAFHILGWWSRAPFMAPDLVGALYYGEPDVRASSPRFASVILDKRRAYAARLAVKAGELTAMPPFRVLSTDWTIAGDDAQPFYLAHHLARG